MKFTPVSEQEAQKSKAKFAPFAPGRYQFEIIQANDEVSSKGNPMLHLVLKVYHPTEDWTRLIHNYITGSMDFMLRHFAYSVGLGIKYEAGAISENDCVGRSGTVALRIQQDAGYPPKNSVIDYIVPENYQDQKLAVGEAVFQQGRQLAPVSEGAAITEADIPFAWHPGAG